jgi:glycosyltransferase involved in cell wall biosynthesis
MQKMKITILSNIYNEENNLKEFLQSIEDQTIQNFDIVFVDDGSTDLSLIILKEFSARNS